jgi:hypothetical protein
MKTRRNFIIVFCVSLLLAVVVGPATSHTQEARLGPPSNIVAWHSGKYIQINWDADPSAALGYNVYRSVGSTEEWEKLTESPFRLTTFVDYAPPASETVYYKVTAVSKEGVEGQDSYALPVETLPPPEKPSAGAQMLAQAYSKDNIITDQQLTDSGAMSLSQIQSFLSSQGSVLANYSTAGKTAAQHIYDACQTHGINPQVVLVTLQKEKGLIKSSTANPENLAMGWNTGDASTSNFADQVYWGTRQFKLYYNNLGGYRDRLGNPWAVGQPREVSDGTVTGANIATPGLYIYTPWIGQGGGGRTGIGGNYLFWDLWANTFGFGSEVGSVVAQPDFKLPLPAGKDWLLSVETGKPTSQCSSGIGGRFYGGGFDCFHTGTSKYSLDFIDNNRQDGELTGRADVDILAAAAGTVSNVITSTTGFGNHVIINHGSGYTTIYGHLKSNSFTVSQGQAVTAGTKIGVMGTTGNSTGIHIHFEVRFNGQGSAESPTLDQVVLDGRRMIDYLVGTTSSPTYYRSNNVSCGNGSSTSFRVNGGPPVHPNGSLVKVSSNNTVYLIWNGQKRGITSESLLQNLYNQENDNFSSSVITVAADELSRYPEGEVISSRLTSNGRGQPDGRLIRQTGGGEISVVTNNGRRRPFASESAFLGLGYLYCNVVDVSDYNSYPADAIADGTSPLPTITSGPTFNTTTPSVGQTLNGSFLITNRGNASITFSALTIGGRLNDSLIRDFPLQTNITLSPDQSWTYEGSLNLSEAGTYKFFPAYRTPDGIWKIGLSNEIGTSTGGSATVTMNVTQACPSVNQTTQPGSGAVGSSVVISGSNLNGVTGVRFSGDVAAGFTVNSDSQITATVPSGAATGPITVSKSGCSDAQTGTFTVTPVQPPPPSPNQPTNVTSSSATLSWSGVNDATQYRVQVSTSSTFNTSPDGRDCFNCLPNGNQVIDAPTTSYNLTGLSAGTTYFWRVRAGRFVTGSEWTTEWSTVGSFPTTQGTIPVTVGTNPSGRSFTVDGTLYTSTQSFDWSPGSSHTISTTSPQDGAPGTRYVWSGWSDGQAMSHTVSPIVATNYTANFTTQHFLTMNAGTGGTVSPASGWRESGEVVAISAQPNGGFVFGGWSGTGTGSYTGPNNPSSVTMSGPVSENASFTSQPLNDFSISASPSSRTVSPGNSTTFTVNTTTTSGNPQSVALSASGLPSGASAAFNPASVMSGASSTLTVTTSAATPPGNHSITVTGTGSSTRHATVTLNVTGGPRNVALASNGATATATSELDAGRAANAVINGDRRGLHWGSDPSTGSGWHDATANAYPDRVQVNFSGSKTINEINVFTIQDNFTSPVEPTETMAFSLYGVTAFDVQYWNGASWVTVPGGSVTGNNKVWRKFTFSPITTSMIRVSVNNALAGHSRIVEVEAYESAVPPPGVNVALAANGGVASASSTLDSGRAASGAINGDRKGLNWGSGGGWHDATGNAFPDWLQVNFSGTKTISEVRVFTIQDNFGNPAEPTDTTAFTLYGVTAFSVEYLDGSTWVPVPGASVSGSSRVKRTFTFQPLTTDRVRVVVNNGLAGYSRLTEVEVY